jgi:hypothetical protein
MSAILTTAEYPEIRAVISLDVDQKALPNDVIALDPYQGEAERWAVRLDPQAATRTGATLRQLKTAIVFKIASFVVKAMPQLIEENFKVGEGFKRQSVDVDARAEDLAQRAADAMAAYLSPTPATKSIPTLFTTAPGRRGR